MHTYIHLRTSANAHTPNTYRGTERYPRARARPPRSEPHPTVSSRKFDSESFKSRVSHPGTIACVRFEMPFDSSNIQGSGPVFPNRTFEDWPYIYIYIYNITYDRIDVCTCMCICMCICMCMCMCTCTCICMYIYIYICIYRYIHIHMALGGLPEQGPQPVGGERDLRL